MCWKQSYWLNSAGETPQSTSSAFRNQFSHHCYVGTQLSGIPNSFTAHGPDEYERATLLALDVKLRHAAFAVCVSYYGRSQLMRWSEPDQWHKIALIHCGLDTRFFEDDLAKIPETVAFA